MDRFFVTISLILLDTIFIFYCINYIMAKKKKGCLIYSIIFGFKKYTNEPKVMGYMLSAM